MRRAPACFVIISSIFPIGDSQSSSLPQRQAYQSRSRHLRPLRRIPLVQLFHDHTPQTHDGLVNVSAKRVYSGAMPRRMLSG